MQLLQADFEKDRNVKAVIVFGSAVEFRCNSYSDLEKNSCVLFFQKVLNPM
ncbi:MAG: hypothetical protein LIP10_05470 [Clostridiales bacterium]|nr:hypothetical protein [Clostridiales bacterium]